MFNFFTALFGGLYYSLKIGGERAEMKAVKREMKLKAEGIESYLARMTDRALEAKLKSMMRDEKCWPELRVRLALYKRLYRPYCAMVTAPIGLSIWDDANPDVPFSIESRLGTRQLVQLECLMMTYGKLIWSTAQTMSILYIQYGEPDVQRIWEREYRIQVLGTKSKDRNPFYSKAGYDYLANNTIPTLEGFPVEKYVWDDSKKAPVYVGEGEDPLLELPPQEITCCRYERETEQWGIYHNEQRITTAENLMEVPKVVKRLGLQSSFIEVYWR